MAKYSIAVNPPNAILGDRIRLTLQCRTSRSATVTTFDDASLALQMARRPSRAEPELAFPNRKAVQEGHRLVRMGGGARRTVQPSERVEQEFDLVSVFPRLALDAGDFRLNYEINDAGQLRHVGPASVSIESGPEAIPRLLDLLSHEDADVRERAAGLIHRMTARAVGYAPTADVAARTTAIGRWRAWWEKSGIHLTWSFRSAGATFGDMVSAAPPNPRSRVVGGIAYRRQTVPIADAGTLSSVLAEWLRTPTAGIAVLRGTVRVADRAVVYPPDDTMLAPDPDIVRLLASALSPSVGVAAHSDPGAALLILATIAKMPDRRFVPALQDLRDSLPKAAGWGEVESIAKGLLDVLDPARIPVGDEG